MRITELIAHQLQRGSASWPRSAFGVSSSDCTRYVGNADAFHLEKALFVGLRNGRLAGKIDAAHHRLAGAVTPLDQLAQLSEAFVKTLERDYVQVTPLPDTHIILGLIRAWIEDYNENHPYSGLKMHSIRKFIAPLSVW